MIHITRDKEKSTILSAEPGLIKLNLGSNLNDSHTEGLLSIVDEILQDLTNADFHGTFSFQDDTVTVTLKSGSETKTWERAVN